MIGSTNLYGNPHVVAPSGDSTWGAPIRFTRTRTLNYLKGTVQVHEGEARIKREKVPEVLRRNGLNGAFIKHWGPDDIYIVLPLPLGPRATIEEARATAAGMKNHAYGPCITARGLGIRVRKDEETAVRSKWSSRE